MMQEIRAVFSLHPVTIEDVKAFLIESAVETSDSGMARRGTLGLELLAKDDSRGPGVVGQALASYLAERWPCFVLAEISLTRWEAAIDRGVGMLLRPPARLLVEAGMERALARRLPIRLDHDGGMMVGAYVPAHLIAQFESLLEERLERELRRLIEADLDPVANMGQLLQALAFARSRGTGLIEAMDIADGLDPSLPVFAADRKRLPKDLRLRLEAAARPPKEPGRIARLFRPRAAESPYEAKMRAFLAGDQSPEDSAD